MRTTRERLSEVYCRPKTEGEWEALYPNAYWMGSYPSPRSHIYWDGTGKYLASWPNEDKGRTEIPFSHFIDLLNDSIVPWRLEDDGFDLSIREGHYTGHSSSLASSFVFIDKRGVVWLSNRKLNNVTTYTDLLTLIRLIG